MPSVFVHITVLWPRRCGGRQLPVAADPIDRAVCGRRRRGYRGARAGQSAVRLASASRSWSTTTAAAAASSAWTKPPKSTPDGYTLLLAHSGLTYMPGLHRKLPFDPANDFDGVVTAVSGIYVLAVNPQLPVKSVAELIAYAKANPGKLSYGSAGIGSSLHLGRRVLQARGRRRHRARALQRRRAGDHRSGRRPDPDDVRSGRRHPAARQGRQAAGAGGDLAPSARRWRPICRRWRKRCRASKSSAGTGWPRRPARRRT